MSDSIGSLRPARSIRFRVLSLVSLIILPLTILFVWLGYTVATEKRQFIEQRRFEITNRISSAVDEQIAIPIGMLVGLAAANELAEGDFEDFRKQAAKLISQPTIARIWVFSSQDTLVATTEEKPGSPASYAIDDPTRERVLSGRRAVSPVRGEGLTNATVVVAVPAMSGGKVIYGLAAEVYIGQLSQTFAQLGMDKSWIAAVVDRNNRFVARSLDAEKRIGELARPELGVAAKGENASGSFENITHEGVSTINWYQRSELTGWTTVVAVPTEQLTAPLRNAFTWILLGGAATALAMLWLATLISQRISEPVRNLRTFAHTLASGKEVPAPVYHIKELDEVRQELERSISRSAQLAAVVASSGDAIISTDLDGTIETWNKGAEELFGFTEDEIVGRQKSALIPKSAEKEYQEQRRRILAGESLRVETARLKKDGSVVDVSLSLAPIRRPDGKVIGMSSTIHDITERKALEEHRRFLMREIAHRSKNQLAIIQSIAGQTARHSESLDEFLTAFRQRLQGISASHDILVAQDWRSVLLRDLITSHMKVFAGISNDNIDVLGPNVRLGPAAAEAVGLALHELATNSVKYGSLSAASGRVAIRWDAQTNSEGKRELFLEWQERDGPAVTKPARKGFGSQVLETLVARSVQGQSESHYLPEGFRWTLRFPLVAT